MANYVEYIKSGNNETWAVRDREAHAKIDGLIKRKTINLGDYTLSWIKSGTGMYYANVTMLSSLGINADNVIGVYAGDWEATSGVSIIQPYIASRRLSLMATAETNPGFYQITITYF
jgi:hypothetical protein